MKLPRPLSFCVKPVLVAGFCCSVFLPAERLAAQSPSATLRAETVLVQVPVIVTDKQGHPVDDLSKAEFAVKEEGKPESIAVFEHVRHAFVPAIKLPVPDGVYTNRVKQDQPARLTIIAIDAVSTAITEREETRKQILDFISKNVSVDQPVALVMLGQNRVKVLHDFTTDPRVLITAIKNVVSVYSAGASITADDAVVQTNPGALGSGEQAVFNQMAAAETNTIQTAFQTFMAGQRRNRVASSLDAFNAIAQAFTGIPGRKSLIWITNGESVATGDLDVAASMDRGQTVLGSTGLPNATQGIGKHESPIGVSDAGVEANEFFERTWRLLNNANIAVYPLDVSEMSNPGLTTPGLRVRSALKRPVTNLGKLEEFAEQTGGSVCYRTDDLDDCFKRASQDSEDYYMLGYYADPANKKTDWRRIQVSSTRKDVRLRARTGYFPRHQKPDNEKLITNEVLTAIGSPLEYTSLPLEVKIEGVASLAGDAHKKTVKFLFFVPPTADFIAGADNRMDLDFAAIAKLSTGRPAAQFSQRTAGALKPLAAADLGIHGMVLPGSMALAPGEYELKFVARDNQSGHMGTVTVPLKVEDGATLAHPAEK